MGFDQPFALISAEGPRLAGWLYPVTQDNSNTLAQYIYPIDARAYAPGSGASCISLEELI